MLDLEFKVMFIRIRAETDLFNDRFGGIRLDFLLFFPLVVEKFIEFNDATDGRIGIRGDHDQILAHVFCPVADGSRWIDPRLDLLAGNFADIIEIVAYEADLGYPDVPIDLEFVFVWF